VDDDGGVEDEEIDQLEHFNLEMTSPSTHSTTDSRSDSEDMLQLQIRNLPSPQYQPQPLSAISNMSLESLQSPNTPIIPPSSHSHSSSSSSTVLSPMTVNPEVNSPEENKKKGKEWVTSLKQQGFLVNKYTWQKGTRRQRIFFLDLGDGDKIDYENALIYWVKKTSKNPQKDQRPHRMLYLKEIFQITPGKSTNTFDQGPARNADENRCLSIHFKVVNKKPQTGDEEVSRTLDLEVETEELCKRIVSILNSLLEKLRKHTKKLNKQMAKKEYRMPGIDESTSIGDV